MAEKTRDDLRHLAVGEVPPAIRGFADWASGELWTRFERAALDMGFSSAEAFEIAKVAIAHATQGLHGAIQQALRDRAFRVRP